MTRFSTAYCVEVAKSVGVPPMWVEDAAQDILVHAWLKNDTRASVLKHSAIDAVRRYGRFSRRGLCRETVSLEPAAKRLLASTDVEAEVMDHLELAAVRGAIPQLSPYERQALARKLAGESRGNVDDVGVYNARRRLRTLLSA